jgi:hypothetical protein
VLPSDVLTIHAVPHPNPQVDQIGFRLDDPYVEHVWTSILGPSAVLMLRRVPVLWQERQPATVDVAEFGRSIGLLRPQVVQRSIDRLVRFGMARWLPSGDLVVPTRVAPLSTRLLDRVPPVTRAAHDRLLGLHLDRLARGHAVPAGDRSAVSDITARLDRLQHTPVTPTRPLSR